MTLYSSPTSKIKPVSKRKRNILESFNYLYILPVVVGVIFFTFVPMGVSLVKSFSTYDSTAFIPEIKWGFDNYITMFTTDWGAVSHSLLITFQYAIITVPLSMIGSYALSLFLHRAAKGKKVITVLLYLPALIPALASTLLWGNITNVEWGYINQILVLLGLDKFPFYSDPNTVLPTIVMMNCIGWGSGTIMWMAQFNNIPKELYEAATIDGAGHTRQLLSITIPMSTSMIFYQLIVHIIGALQVFSGYYPLISLYPQSESALKFFVVKIYMEAFEGSKGLPYACALSWLLFVIIGLLTLTIFKTSKWVYYGEEQ